MTSLESLRAKYYRARARLIDKALTQTNGNKAQAARLLGCNRTMIVEAVRSIKRLDPAFPWSVEGKRCEWTRRVVK